MTTIAKKTFSGWLVEIESDSSENGNQAWISQASKPNGRCMSIAAVEGCGFETDEGREIPIPFATFEKIAAFAAEYEA